MTRSYPILTLLSTLYVSQVLTNSFLTNFVETPSLSTDKKVITLEKNNLGYSAKVQFMNIGNLPTGADLKMQLALYTRETWVVEENLQQLLGLTPGQYKGSSNEKTTIKTPYDIIQGVYSNMPVILDTENWKTKGVFIAQGRTRKLSQFNCGIFGYGLLGMGKSLTANAAQDSGKSASNFAIYKDKKSSDFKLEFNADIPSDKLLQSLVIKSNDNWAMSVSEVKLADDVINGEPPVTKVIFDLNDETIGLPKPYYDEIVNRLTKLYGLTCTMFKEPYRVSCKISHGKRPKLESMPNINIQLGSIQKIIVTPKMYIDYSPEASDELILNLRSLESDKSYQKMFVLEDYSNYIILGSKYLEDHLTIFNLDGYNIHIFDQKTISLQKFTN
ncbi:MAG: hypothetical protein EOP45_17785 [Sphingobacteriaceae bacterium]|nr:MAG: hypothetical protein EOP45_17785 [Sphingobacteriaceae bacterium]